MKCKVAAGPLVDLLTPHETAEALDSALEQMRTVGSFSSEAHRVIGRLYLPT